jgi:RimJ/RimL family protein N-acetyltransferase
MENIRLRKATSKDIAVVVDFDYNLDKDEHIKLNREEKITKAISNDECFLILVENQEVGFVIFDYRFFDQGWIELIIINEKYRGKGIGGKTFDLVCEQCKSDKVFTSTNSSNIQMQRALSKADFAFSGEINGLDDGDPERFYFKWVKKKR